MSLYGWAPIQAGRIFPDSRLPEEIDSRVALRATPGEVEPASFVIRANQALSDIGVRIGPLMNISGTGEMKPSVLDIRIVKVWFQAGNNFGMRKGKKTFVPELLLKDEELVRVDSEIGRQWIKTTKDGKTRFFEISNPESSIPADVEVHDAKQLQPFSMKENESKQLWLTLRAPENIASGTYVGKISVSAAGVPEQALAIEVEILPFTLEASDIETSLYYRGQLFRKPAEPRGWRNKQPQAYRWDMESLVDHGVMNPSFTHYGSPEPHEHLDQELTIRRESGMPKGPVYMNGLTLGKPRESRELAALERKVRHWIGWFGDRGYGPVYFYGVDEAKKDALVPQIAGWKLTRRLGGRVMVAGYVGAAEIVDRVLDMPILAYDLDSDEAKRYQIHGHRVYSYANPQVGYEDPLVYRRNYGFSIWKAGYNGSMTYAYQHGYDEIWNDFDGTEKYRDHVFAYPTDSGLVETIQYEGFREANDDLRYLATLMERIDRVILPGDRLELHVWLDRLDLELDPELIRNMIIAKILELDSAR